MDQFKTPFSLGSAQGSKDETDVENCENGLHNMGLGFFTSAVDTLRIVVTAIGSGVAVWGIINLLEGYGNDNPGAKSQGIKQLMAGGGIVIIAQTVIPQLSTLFS